MQLKKSESSRIPWEWLDERITGLRAICEQLLRQPRVPFRENNESIRSKLPDEPGLYVISQKSASTGDFLRAGKTNRSLRQRICQNHLMGNQNGNLPQQLIGGGVCQDLHTAKSWIRDNCYVQFLVMKEDAIRSRAEHFMSSVIRPTYCD
jgi:hypothetical protein